MIKGRLLATTNYDDIIKASQAGFKILFVGDVLDSPTNIHGIVNAVPFTPDYNALSAIINGDTETFDGMYMNSLTSQSATEMIAVIVMALVNGTNILMYFPTDVMQLRYPYILRDFLAKNHGLIFDFDARTFNYNPKFNFCNTRLVYLYNMIDAISFINASDGQGYDGLVINKLRNDIQTNMGANTSVMSDQQLLVFIDNLRHKNNNQKVSPPSQQQQSQNNNKPPAQKEQKKPVPPKKRNLFEEVQQG